MMQISFHSFSVELKDQSASGNLNVLMEQQNQVETQAVGFPVIQYEKCFRKVQIDWEEECTKEVSRELWRE